MKILCFPILRGQKNFAPGNGGGGGGGGGGVYGKKCKQGSAQYHQKFCASIS